MLFGGKFELNSGNPQCCRFFQHFFENEENLKLFFGLEEEKVKENSVLYLLMEEFTIYLKYLGVFSHISTCHYQSLYAELSQQNLSWSA